MWSCAFCEPGGPINSPSNRVHHAARAISFPSAGVMTKVKDLIPVLTFSALLAAVAARAYRRRAAKGDAFAMADLGLLRRINGSRRLPRVPTNTEMPASGGRSERGSTASGFADLAREATALRDFVASQMTPEQLATSFL